LNTNLFHRWDVSGTFIMYQGFRGTSRGLVPLRELSSMCPICLLWVLYYGNKRRERRKPLRQQIGHHSCNEIIIIY
jgi:hypothetical protein